MKASQLIKNIVRVDESPRTGPSKGKQAGSSQFLCSATGDDGGYGPGDLVVCKSYNSRAETAVDLDGEEITVYDAEKVSSILSRLSGAKYVCTADGEGGLAPGEIFLAVSYDEELCTAESIDGEEESVFMGVEARKVRSMLEKS